MKTSHHNSNSFWAHRSNADVISKNVERISGAVTHLPLAHWKEKMFFVGAEDRELDNLTEGKFPAKVVHRKTHPIFSLRSLPGGCGFVVCPCSSKRPYSQKTIHLIREGCKLIHTGYVMDRTSYLVDHIRFSIPRLVAYSLWFKGEVPNECIVTSVQEKT